MTMTQASPEPSEKAVGRPLARVRQGLAHRQRISVYGVLVFFFFVFGGLFVGFIIAHLFPETVISVAMGVRTDREGIVEPTAGIDAESIPTAANEVEPRPGGADVLSERAEAPTDGKTIGEGLDRPSQSDSQSAAGMGPPASAPLIPSSTPSYAGAWSRRKPEPPMPAKEIAAPMAGPGSAVVKPVSPSALTPPNPAPGPPPSSSANAPLAPSESVASAPGSPGSLPPPRVVARQKPPLPQGVTAPPADIASFAPADQMEMSQWATAETPAGHFDALALHRGGATIDAKTPAQLGDIFEVQGWAGEGSIGLPIRDVVFSICGRAVGHARVEGMRPDVAEKIHPNLGRSAWHARLLAAHLPRCANGQLSAWAVLPGAGTLLPLANVFPVGLAPIPPGTAMPPGARAFGPRDVARPKLVPVEILASSTEMRRCGRADCAVVGELFAGTQQGYIADDGGDWALVVFVRIAGWIHKSQFRVGS